MTFDLYAAINSLAVSFAHFLIGSSKLILPRNLCLFFFAYHLCLEYSLSDESDESYEEESVKIGPESVSAGTFINRLGEL